MNPARAIALSTFWLVVLAAEVGAQSHAPGDYFGPREIALGESMRADARGALATTLNPAGLALGSELVFEGSFGHRVEDSANSITVSGCDSTVPMPGCFYYRYFSATPELDGSERRRRVHEGGSTLARGFSRLLTVGLNVKYFDYESELMDEGDSSGFTIDVGAVVRPIDVMALGLVGYHLIGDDSPQYPRMFAVGVTVRPLSSLSLSFDGLWNMDVPDDQSTGRYGGGIEFFIRPGSRQIGYPLRAGAVHDVGADRTFVTAGIGLLSSKLGIDVGARQEIDGGDELLVQASVRIFGPRRIPGTTRYRY